MQQSISTFGDPFDIPKSLISNILLMLNHVESMVNLSLKSPGMLLGKCLQKKKFFFKSKSEIGETSGKKSMILFFKMKMTTIFRY